MPEDTITLAYPAWVRELEWSREYRTDAERIALAIEVSRRNVALRTGGPFGAAIFDDDTGALVSVGMNMVAPLGNSTLHAEMVAFQLAQKRVGSHSLAEGGRRHALYASCEPCAMCFGATLWSGVHRLVCGATAADAGAIGFDEGPVFPESWRYIEARGVKTLREQSRAEAKAVLDGYFSGGGVIYNGNAS